MHTEIFFNYNNFQIPFRYLSNNIMPPSKMWLNYKMSRSNINNKYLRQKQLKNFGSALKCTYTDALSLIV